MLTNEFWKNGAVVKRHFKLLGRNRRPGTKIFAKTLERLTLRNRRALEDGGYVTFIKEDSAND